jgi:hypothetical protein
VPGAWAEGWCCLGVGHGDGRPGAGRASRRGRAACGEGRVARLRVREAAPCGGRPRAGRGTRRAAGSGLGGAGARARRRRAGAAGRRRAAPRARAHACRMSAAAAPCGAASVGWGPAVSDQRREATRGQPVKTRPARPPPARRPSRAARAARLEAPQSRPWPRTACSRRRRRPDVACRSPSHFSSWILVVTSEPVYSFIMMPLIWGGDGGDRE